MVDPAGQDAEIHTGFPGHAAQQRLVGGFTLEGQSQDAAVGFLQVFLQFVFVGSNLFSTSEIEQQITLETTSPFYGRYYTIVIEKCSAFLLDDLNNSKMEDHPVALSFINSIIKNSLRNSQLR